MLPDDFPQLPREWCPKFAGSTISTVAAYAFARKFCKLTEIMYYNAIDIYGNVEVLTNGVTPIGQVPKCFGFLRPRII